MTAGLSSLIKIEGSELTAEIRQLREEVCKLGGRLTETDQLLKTSRDSQVPLNEKVNTTVSELANRREEVQKIVEERERIDVELKCKQRDSQLLSEMKMDLANSAEKCQLMKKLIDDMTKEIKRLEEKLEKKNYKLKVVKEETRELQKNLSKLQAELDEKHEEVKKLRKEKEVLCKSRMEKIVSIIFTPAYDQEEMKVDILIAFCISFGINFSVYDDILYFLRNN